MLVHSLGSTVWMVAAPRTMAIILRDEGTKRYGVRVAVGVPEEVARRAGFGPEHPLARGLLRHPQGIDREDAAADGELRAGLEERQAGLLVPLIHDDDLLGVIGVGGSDPRRRVGAAARSCLLDLGASAALALINIRLAEERTKSLVAGIRSLVEAIEAKDAYTRGHCERVADIATTIGTHLGLTEREVEMARMAAVLHDIGKIGIDEQVLTKKGRLTPEEYEQIKRHPGIGARIVEGIPLPREVRDAIYLHDERWDGRGYPEGRRGAEIPLLARILELADAYEAMTSSRSYRAAMPKEKAIGEVLAGKGAQFDPAIVEAFLETIDLLELKTDTH
jgi:putative nucleotidyltransferase with HDIG domain